MKRNTHAMKILLMLIPLTLISLSMTASAHSDFTITSPSPADGETNVTIHPALPISAYLNCTTGDNVTAIAWYKIGLGGAVTVSAPSPEAWCNDTMNWNINASLYSTTYYWGWNVTNTSTGHWTNSTFHFTTEDEPVAESDLDPQTRNIIEYILPVLIATALLSVMVGIIFTIGITKESLISIMVMIIIGIVIIQVIMGL